MSGKKGINLTEKANTDTFTVRKMDFTAYKRELSSLRKCFPEIWKPRAQSRTSAGMVSWPGSTAGTLKDCPTVRQVTNNLFPLK